MSLKQECIDMIKLILDPLMQDDDDFYDVVTDEQVKFCIKTGGDLYEMFCNDCSDYRKNSNCPHLITEKVDISLFSSVHMEDVTKYFIFNRKPKHPELKDGIYYIHNREQLLKVMMKYKKEVEYFRDGYAEYAKKIDDYTEHAQDFYKQITNDFSIFASVDYNMMPIVYYSNYREDHDNKSKEYIGGDFQANKKQSIIHIYNTWDENKDNVKQRIRHEMLHYLLWCVGLPCGDDTAMFHYFCHQYDAKAYVELKDKVNHDLLKASELLTRQEMNMICVKCLDVESDAVLV